MTSALRVVTDESVSTETEIAYFVSFYNTAKVHLSQGRWAELQEDVERLIDEEVTVIMLGVWYTSPITGYQSMCISFSIGGEFPEMAIRSLKGSLKGISEEYAHIVIRWAEAYSSDL